MRSLKVLLESTQMIRGPYRGMGIYIRNLSRHLNPLADVSLWFPLRILPLLIHSQKNFRVHPFLKYSDYDIFHTTSWYKPRGIENWILTIHDLFPFCSELHKNLGYPVRAMKRMKKFQRKIKNLINQKPKAIIFPSETEQRNFSQFFPEFRPVFTIHHGIKKLADKEESSNFRLPDRFILTVGSGDRRKNIKNAIKAIRILRKTGEEIPWLIVGKKPMKDILDIDRTIFVSKLSERQLHTLYKKATIFFFPTVYEGFGLPLLESLSYGTPSVASNLPVFKEIFDDTFLPVDPLNPEAMAQGIERLFNDEELRVLLSQKGKKIANLYSWDKTARKTVGVYKSIL